MIAGLLNTQEARTIAGVAGLARIPFLGPLTSSRRLLTFLAAGFLTLSAQSGPAPASGLTRAQKEEFLLKAKVVKTTSPAKGITDTVRATLSDGQITHDASIQRIDETKRNYETPFGTELIFRDSWYYNVAAYKLDRLLGLNMIPATVDRTYQGSHGSFTWWVDDVLMDEGERQSKKAQAPDKQVWDDQMSAVNVFDQLIYNIDRNMGNLLYDKNWQIWMIDHTRAFRSNTALMDEKVLTRCDSALLEKMKQLDADTLKKELGPYDIDGGRIKGLLARRDRIVKIFQQKGPSAMYSMPRRPE
jgi:hypothetical protein